MAPMQHIDVKDLPPEVLQPNPSVSAIIESVAPSSAVPAPTSAADVGRQGHPLVGAGEVNGLHAGGEVIHTTTSATWPATPEASNSPAILNEAADLSDEVAWQAGLRTHALALLRTGRTDVWDTLTQRFERTLIEAALSTTRGRRIEASLKLGIGRNTLTRKIQELGMDKEG
jgi:two-component system nitrogen regulation response regulator GlnG